jgi:hypothetical protein
MTVQSTRSVDLPLIALKVGFQESRGAHIGQKMAVRYVDTRPAVPTFACGASST